MSEEATIGGWIGFFFGICGIHQFLRVVFSLHGATWYSDDPYGSSSYSPNNLADVPLGQVRFITPWQVYCEEKPFLSFRKRTQGGDGANYYVNTTTDFRRTSGGTVSVRVFKNEQGKVSIVMPSKDKNSIHSSIGFPKDNKQKVLKVQFV